MTTVFSRSLIFLGLMSLLSCNENPTGPQIESRSYRQIDTTHIWVYASPPANRSRYGSLAFPSIQDSVNWSTTYDENGWIFIWFEIATDLNHWEFAFTSTQHFDLLAAPDTYSFYGASNYDKSPQDYWYSYGFFYDLDDSPILLASRIGNPFPVFAFRAHTIQMHPPRLYPEDHFLEVGILLRPYY